MYGSYAYPTGKSFFVFSLAAPGDVIFNPLSLSNKALTFSNEGTKKSPWACLGMQLELYLKNSLSSFNIGLLSLWMVFGGEGGFCTADICLGGTCAVTLDNFCEV